jgi:hypothetical protein
MHSPKGKEDQGDWVFEEADEEADEASQEAGEGEEADPSFVPLSPSAELLDWGSDLVTVRPRCRVDSDSGSVFSRQSDWYR